MWSPSPEVIAMTPAALRKQLRDRQAREMQNFRRRAGVKSRRPWMQRLMAPLARYATAPKTIRGAAPIPKASLTIHNLDRPRRNLTADNVKQLERVHRNQRKALNTILRDKRTPPNPRGKAKPARVGGKKSKQRRNLINLTVRQAEAARNGSQRSKSPRDDLRVAAATPATTRSPNDSL